MQKLNDRVSCCLKTLKTITEGETASKKENKALEDAKQELLSIEEQLTEIEVLFDKLQAIREVIADNMFLDSEELTENDMHALCYEHKRNCDLFGIMNDYMIQFAKVLNGEGFSDI